MTRSVLITGANRGIGLGFVKHYLEDGWQVYAVVRGESSELTALKESHDALTVHPLEITDFDAVDSFAATLAPASLDLLINNAGAYGENQNFGQIDYNAWRRVLEINTLAPVKLSEALIEAMKPGSTIAMISSLVGSIGEASADGFIYSTSKAALNMAARRLSIVLKDRKVTVLPFHPGSVVTDMNQSGKISVTDSVSGMAQIIDSASLADSGTFKDWQGRKLAW